MRNDTTISRRLVGFLTGEARGDDWERRRARLLAMQSESRPNVALHAARVAANARLLALDVGLAEPAAAALHDAAMLHDAGKLAVSEEVLYKNGPLDADQRAEMQMHAAYGFGLLDVPGAPEVVLDVAKYHHERYADGLGYFGVRGEAIPYAARIVAVADVHEALTARREYKPAMPEGEALAMMTAGAPPPGLGRAAFDPFLLRRFVAMRLRDPALQASPAQRIALEEFARSDPNAELGDRRDLQISRSGIRMHFDVADGHRTLVAMTRADGSVSTEFPRLAPAAGPAPRI